MKFYFPPLLLIKNYSSLEIESIMLGDLPACSVQDQMIFTLLSQESALVATAKSALGKAAASCFGGCKVRTADLAFA